MKKGMRNFCLLLGLILVGFILEEKGSIAFAELLNNRMQNLSIGTSTEILVRTGETVQPHLALFGGVIVCGVCLTKMGMEKKRGRRWKRRRRKRKKI